MKSLVCCATLMVFGAGIAADLTAERTSVSKSRFKIPNVEDELNEAYETLLLKFAKNHFKVYEINVVLLSSDCPMCDRILGLLMDASAQSFLTLNDIASPNHAPIANASRLVPGIGYFESVLILTENISEFYEHLANLRSMYAWNPRARHLIFAVKKPGDNELEMIFKECWTHRVINAAVTVSNQEEAYTYNPYLKNGSEIRENIADWSKLFYDKLKNMNGHSIRTRYIPFASAEAEWIAEEGRYKYFGSDFGYGEAFFQSVKATPEFMDLTAETVHLYRNLTYRQLLWVRGFDDVELWINFMPYQIECQDRAERPYPALMDNLRVLVPKSGLKTPSVFEPYNGITWTCVVLSLVSFAVYTWVLYKRRRINDNAFFRTFGVFLGKNLANRRHGVLEKSTFLVFTMTSLLILSAYQGALYGALTTVSYYPDINTLPELRYRVKKLSTYSGIASYFQAYVPPGISVKGFDAEDYVEYMRTHRDEAFVFPHSIAVQAVRLKVLSEDTKPFYHIMKDFSLPIFSSHVVPYGSPYLKKLEKVFLLCKEAGLTQYWEEEVDLNAILSGAVIPNVVEGRKLKKLSLQTQLTAFYIWFTGLLISSFCFAAELYVYNNGKKNLAHHFIVEQPGDKINK